MISSKEKEKIKSIAQKFHADKVLLFGSMLNSKNGRDIDLGVSGISPMQFFTFYGELMMSLSRPVDVIDMDEGTNFTEHILTTGKTLYERP